MSTRDELEAIIARRPGGQLGQIVVDNPKRLGLGMTRAWPRRHTDGPIVHRSMLHVLSNRGRALLAEVADATAYKRTWGAQLVVMWIGAWRERERFIDYITEFPSATPGLFSGGAMPWTREPSPPIVTGDDIAASLLVKHKLDHAAALAEALATEYEETTRWRVITNLRLAPFKRDEALALWPR